AWRVAVLGLERNKVIEHFFLAFGQGHGGASIRKSVAKRTLGEKKANVKYHFRGNSSVCVSILHPAKTAVAGKQPAAESRDASPPVRFAAGHRSMVADTFQAEIHQGPVRSSAPYG